MNVIGNTEVEPDETFTVSLGNAIGATIAIGTASSTITNDDAPPAAPALSIAATNAVQTEGNSGTKDFTFTVTRANATGLSTVNWALEHGTTAPADFAGATSGTLAFADGETSKTITVQVNGDTVVEGNETFSVVLNEANNATVTTGTASGTITNDDVPPAPTNAAPSAPVLNGSSVGEYAGYGTVVGTVSAVDPNGDGLTYSLVDNAGGLFAINAATGQIIVAGALNFEQAPSHKITVVASDGKGGDTAQTFNITVGDELTLTKRGTSKNDKINGTNLDDHLFGRKGNDTVKGLGGDDKLYGEVGDDKLYGGEGFDRLSGGKGNDLLKGDAGNDRLYGDEGNDQLYGGAGQDVFAFTTKLSKTGNLDQIRDFKVADDTIWLENRIFSKLGSAGSEAAPAALNRDFFKVGSKAKDRNDYIVYDNKKGILYYDADGNGKRAAVEITKLAKNLKLTADDFSVI